MVSLLSSYSVEFVYYYKKLQQLKVKLTLSDFCCIIWVLDLYQLRLKRRMIYVYSSDTKQQLDRRNNSDR